VSRALVLLVLLLGVACTPAKKTPPALRVGTSGDYPPFSVHGEQGYQGLDIAVAQRFAQDTGRTLQVVDFRWPALELDLAAGRFDVAMGGVTMRPWRARVGTFTRPIAHPGAVVLVNPDVATSIAHLDAAGHRIGVNAGGHLERVARRLFPHANVTPVATNLWLPELFEGKKIDAIMSDELEAPVFRMRVSAALTFGPLTRDHKAYLARDPALARELDAWLRAREADGWLSSARARYLGTEWATPRTLAASDLDALLALIDLRLAFMPSVALAKESAGLPTLDPVQESRVRARASERATLLGVSPAAIDGLVDTLLAAARASQDAVRAMPASERPPIEVMDLEQDMRPALASLSDEIVAVAADLAHDPRDPMLPGREQVAGALDPSVTPAAERLAIATAVLRLTAAE
jgi:cyclohexadienyl dehydratase